MKKIILLLILLIPIRVNGLASNAKSSILIDYNTGTIIHEFNSNERLPMASMTKMMTLLIIMEKIENKTISLNDVVYISKNAANMGGSQIYLEENTKMKLDTLLKSIAISSSNDSVVAVAEHISGSVEKFVELMNDKAKELNLNNTHFMNPHGLDAEDHYSSAYDMAYLARELLKHELILKYSSIYEDYIEHENGTNTWIVNTNKLINHYEGLDGLKTGFTNKSGYCITATAKRGDLRLISVVMGEETNNQRNIDTIELLNYGFSNYKVDEILNTKSHLGTYEIKFGNKELSRLAIKENIYFLTKKEEKNNYSYTIDIDDIITPIKKNDVVGTINIYSNGIKINEYDLIASEDVKKGNILHYFKRNFMNLIRGFR